MNILILPGSIREQSFNAELARLAGEWIKTNTEHQVTLLGSEMDLPLYNGDLEDQGIPEGVEKLQQHIAQADALIVVCPEYNGFPTPLLVNAIDWVSRPTDAYPKNPMQGKMVAQMAASPGAAGGLRTLIHLRAFLSQNGMHVIPKQFGLGGAGDIHKSGLDEKQEQRVASVIQSLIDTAS